MTVEMAEEIIGKMHMETKVAIRHRFGGDKGTILRLDNDAMINIFDDGRYYIQGENTDELVIAFGIVEEAWDPDKWTGEIKNPKNASEQSSSRTPRLNSGSRFEF